MKCQYSVKNFLTFFGEDYITGVCIGRTRGEHKFYVHDFLIEGRASPFNRAALKTGVDSGGDAYSTNNIRSELLNVKRNLGASSGENKTEEPTSDRLLTQTGRGDTVAGPSTHTVAQPGKGVKEILKLLFDIQTGLC